MKNEELKLDEVSINDIPVCEVFETCNDMPNFATLAALCGLSFPDSANDFQKAMLVVAHMMAALRESVLKGAKIPVNLIADVDMLFGIAVKHADNQVNHD